MKWFPDYKCYFIKDDYLKNYLHAGDTEICLGRNSFAADIDKYCATHKKL
jgi:hypothetical protein